MTAGTVTDEQEIAGSGASSPWETMLEGLARAPQFYTPVVPTVLWDPGTFAGPGPLTTIAGGLFDLDTGRRPYTPDPTTTHTETQRHHTTHTQPQPEPEPTQPDDNSTDRPSTEDDTPRWTADPDGPPPF